MTANIGWGLLLVAFALLILIADDLVYGARRVWRAQRSRFQEPLSRLRERLRLRRGRPRFQAPLTDIRDFVVNLQLAMSLEETMAGALVQTAEQFAARGVFGERLKRHVRSRVTIAPEEVIRGLAEDFGSEQLRDVLTRMTLAREGGLSYVEALAASVEAIENEIRAQIEGDIQRAPLILTVPMVVGVFFAALILAAYPLLSYFIRTLAGSF